VDIIGLAKMRTERDPFAEEVAHSAERVFLPGRKNPVVLLPNSSALFLQRFAMKTSFRDYHRQLRAKERLGSPLDTIPVGPRAARHCVIFGSLKRVRAATSKSYSKSPALHRQPRRLFAAGAHKRRQMLLSPAATATLVLG
jgi:excinuclease ABC subunit C